MSDPVAVALASNAALPVAWSASAIQAALLSRAAISVDPDPPSSGVGSSGGGSSSNGGGSSGGSSSGGGSSGGSSSYVLPVATATTLGGVKIGSGVTVASDGTISVTGGSGGSVSQPAEPTFTAGANVFGSRGLMFDVSGDVILADPSAAGYVWAGVATQAANAGQTLTVVDSETFSFSAWAWTPQQPLYVTANGVLTQAPPTSGVLHQIGYALTATEILIAPMPPISLN
jgi:hypothetical protein